MLALTLLLVCAQDASPIDAESVRAAADVIGATFDEGEIELMLDDVREDLASFERLRVIPLENSLEPAPYFLPGRRRYGTGPVERATRATPDVTLTPTRPEDLEELAFADIRTLHGIPWVAKDLRAVGGTPTTRGAEPFKDQVIETDAAVVQLLDEAGAVLIAKVALGAHAWGDVWFGGRTMNPWKLDQGSSGSSAGPASAVAGGCATFGIGSEPLGSIVSPSTRCGNSSLRPTFGRVSRWGAMALAWSMDDLGPICRSADDAAIVLDAIHGSDPRDSTTVSVAFDPFAPTTSIDGARVGVRALVHPSFEGGLLTATNLSGHPTFVAPSGFGSDGTPYSISFTAKLFGETELMRIARAWQASTDYHLKHPDLK